jgi:hypothetical protein
VNHPGLLAREGRRSKINHTREGWWWYALRASITHLVPSSRRKDSTLGMVVVPVAATGCTTDATTSEATLPPTHNSSKPVITSRAAGRAACGLKVLMTSDGALFGRRQAAADLPVAQRPSLIAGGRAGSRYQAFALLKESRAGALVGQRIPGGCVRHCGKCMSCVVAFT